jgi:HIV Tat-specific factor 1
MSAAPATYSIPLANNWTAYWNPQHAKYYFHNSTTNENTWERPQDSVASGEATTTTASTAVPIAVIPPEAAVYRPRSAAAAAVASSSVSAPTTITTTTDASKRTFVAPDGNVFEWSEETKTWELRDHDSSQPVTKAKGGKKKKSNNKRGKQLSTAVYFAGVPKDATISEVEDVFKRYGVIKTMVDGSKLIKLYKDKDSNELKGDGTVTYLMRPSVDNAINILNGAQFRPGCVITVQEAAYGGSSRQGTGGSSSTAVGASRASGASGTSGASADTSSSSSSSVNATEPPRKRQRGGGGGGGGQNERQKKVQRLKEAQVLSWEEGESEHKGLKIVVLKHVFRPNDLNDAFERKLEIIVAGRCEKCGPLEKLTMYSSHKDGVMIARFSTSYGAEQCVATMHGTHCLDPDRVMDVQYWDGTENFEPRRNHGRNHEEEEQRIDDFGDWLEGADPDEHLTELDRVQPSFVQPSSAK